MLKKKILIKTSRTFQTIFNQVLVFDKPNKLYYFIYNSNGLSFIKDSNNPRQILHIDFLKGALGWRMKRAQHESNLKKALGKNSNQLTIFDATAGLLTDTMIFLSLGHELLLLSKVKYYFHL